MDFDRRSRAAMYLSNLTLKLNGKASSSINRATAWSVPELESRTSGMLILGYTMSSGSGTSGKMVVCGSCLLDSSGMRFAHSAMVQDKDTVVAGTVMKNMVKVSMSHGDRGAGGIHNIIHISFHFASSRRTCTSIGSTTLVDNPAVF